MIAALAFGGISIALEPATARSVKPAPGPPISVPVRFTDIARAAGINFKQDATATDQKYYLETMGTGLGWVDYDQDGLMDLYLVQSASTDIYKPPQPLRSALYHNNGDGTFTDVSEKSGVGKPEAKGMGVVLADVNNDGWPDIIIANDTWPNFLFLNNHDGTFRDVSFSSGMAASEDGKYEAGMGIDAADVDGDGWLDIYVTHLDFELNRLYHNNHDETFDDATYASGIGNKAIFLSGVTMKFMDYDNDGWTDICQVNGAMLDNINLYHTEVQYPEPKLMFRNLGKGKFEKVSEALGPDFMKPVAGRGLAVADFDNDGDLDLAVNVRGGYPELLRNDGANANHWLELFLIGAKSNRDGIGATLKLVSEGFTQMKQAEGGTGYMSASDPRIHFGLGQRKTIESLEVTWPSGVVDKLSNIPINQIVAVKEGGGIVPRNFPRIAAK